MHDYHAVRTLIERLTGDDAGPSAERVAQVRVRAGAVFSPEALQQAYEMLTPGTRLEGSELVVEERPHEIACPACGRTWALGREDLAGDLAICPSCGAASPLGGGAAIELVSVTHR